MHDAVVAADPSAELERVWREHGTKLWRSLFAFAGDPDVASDALAEAFAQALAAGPRVRDPAAWVWRASFKIAAGDLKRRRAAPPVEGVSPPVTPAPEPLVDLVAALRTLSPNQRAAAVLYWYADLPTREVAQALGCSHATVRVHLSQARRRLRRSLEDHDA